MIVNILFRKIDSKTLEADFFEANSVEEAINKLVNAVLDYNRRNCILVHANIPEINIKLLDNGKVPEKIKNDYKHILNK